MVVQRDLRQVLATAEARAAAAAAAARSSAAGGVHRS